MLLRCSRFHTSTFSHFICVWLQVCTDFAACSVIKLWKNDLRIIFYVSQPNIAPAQHSGFLNPHISSPAKPQINTKYHRLNILASVISVFCVRGAVWLTHSFNIVGKSTCCCGKTTSVTDQDSLWSPSAWVSLSCLALLLSSCLF